MKTPRQTFRSNTLSEFAYMQSFGLLPLDYHLLADEADIDDRTEIDHRKNRLNGIFDTDACRFKNSALGRHYCPRCAYYPKCERPNRRQN